MGELGGQEVEQWYGGVWGWGGGGEGLECGGADGGRE